MIFLRFGDIKNEKNNNKKLTDKKMYTEIKE